MNIIGPQQTYEMTTKFSSIPIVERNLLSPQVASIRDKPCWTEEEIRKKTGELYLCHITSYLPQGGCLRARVKYTPDECPLPLREIFDRALSITTPTLHFTVNHVVQPHSQYQHSTKPIIILEPATEVAISGGYLEDVFCLGSHQIGRASCRERVLRLV